MIVANRLALARRLAVLCENALQRRESEADDGFGEIIADAVDHERRNALSADIRGDDRVEAVATAAADA
ncbi:MAG: hypothetical protein ACRDLP_12480 [Solirubrobacteraceae bacterium]